MIISSKSGLDMLEIDARMMHDAMNEAYGRKLLERRGIS
jgi:hypothetical protein